jgi:hypothetical protein
MECHWNDQIKEVDMGRTCCTPIKLKQYIIGNFEETRPLGNLRHGCANGNIEVNLQEVWCEGEGSILVTVGGAKWWKL